MTERDRETRGGNSAGTHGLPVRRPYKRPALVAYGALAKLTRGQGSGAAESTPQGMMMK